MALEVQHVFTIGVELGETRVVGKTAAGLRRVIPIAGGTVTGPALSGEVLPGGADWNVVRPDGVVEVWARYEIRTAEGIFLSVVNAGHARIEPGAAFVMATHPVFEVPEGGPQWLADGFFLGELRPGDGRVSIEVSQVRAGR